MRTGFKFSDSELREITMFAFELNQEIKGDLSPEEVIMQAIRYYKQRRKYGYLQPKVQTLLRSKDYK